MSAYFDQLVALGEALEAEWQGAVPAVDALEEAVATALRENPTESPRQAAALAVSAIGFAFFGPNSDSDMLRANNVVAILHAAAGRLARKT